MDFQTKLQDLMAEYNLGIKNTAGLSGDELDEAISNNEGMEQLYLEITKLHRQFLAEQLGNIGMKKGGAAKEKKEAKPKRARAPAKAKKSKSESEAEPAKLDVVTDSESEAEEKEKPAKKMRAPAKKDVNGEKAAKAPSAYSLFTSHITKINKGSRVGCDIRVKVTLDNTTEATDALLADEKAKPLVELKGQVTSIMQILETCQQLLIGVEGKIHAFKLSSLMWAAVGNKNPF